MILLLLTLSVSFAGAGQEKIVLDDFENGVSKWTTNDNTKTESTSATLLALLPSAGANQLQDSRGGGLFTFKAAQNSWASASLRVDGAAWAKIGARHLTFYLNAGGNKTGFEVLIRRIHKPGQDEVFRLPEPVRLDVTRWRKVAIPLEDFKSDRDKAPLTSRLEGVYLLQFAMRGSWDARFFTVDQLQVEGTGRPVSAPASPPSAPTSTSTSDAGAPVTSINVDYLRATKRLRSAANISVGTNLSARSPLQESAAFRSALHELKPRFVRLNAGELSELTNSSRPAFELRRLQAAVTAARSVGMQPIIVVSLPGDWGLDARGYAAFATQVAEAVNAKDVGPAQTFELATAEGTLSDKEVVAYYNAARAALKKLNSKYRVGGVTCSAGRTGTLQAILRDAQGLDFLSVQDFGTWVGEPEDESLLRTALEAARLHAVAAMLEKSRWKNAELYAVSNLSAVRAQGQSTPADERTAKMIAGAWWASYLSNASLVADQIFHNNASVPEWGLLDKGVRAYPTYYAMWLWNTFVPSGSVRVHTEVSGSKGIAALGLNTATAHNLLLINTTAEKRTAQIGIRGFPVLRQARIRIYDNPRSLPRALELPKSPYQTIELQPYATAMVQFIEPPKN